jgi:hypothetical protein
MDNNDKIQGNISPRDSNRATTPYSNKQLDLLVQGILKGIKDTPAWKKLVCKIGEAEALEVLRAGIYNQGPSPLNEKPNLN